MMMMMIRAILLREPRNLNRPCRWRRHPAQPNWSVRHARTGGYPVTIWRHNFYFQLCKKPKQKNKTKQNKKKKIQIPFTGREKNRWVYETLAVSKTFFFLAFLCWMGSDYNEFFSFLGCVVVWPRVLVIIGWNFVHVLHRLLGMVLTWPNIFLIM